MKLGEHETKVEFRGWGVIGNGRTEGKKELKSEEEIDFSKGSKLDHTTGFHGFCFMEQDPVEK